MNDGHLEHHLQHGAPLLMLSFQPNGQKLLSVGNTSRRRLYEAHVVARCYGIGSEPSHGEILDPPILVARATGTAVTPLEYQRLTPARFKGKPRSPA